MLRSPDSLQQFAAAVDDLGVINKIIGRVDHAKELQYPADAVETAERSNKGAEHSKANLSSRNSGLIHGDALTDLPLGKASILLERQVTRQINVPAVDETGLVKPSRFRQWWQDEAKRIKCLLR